MAEGGFDMAACLERVRQQDDEAARALVNELYPLVIKLVRAHLPRRTGEEDLAQMIFAKIFSNLGQYSGLVPIEHWVSRIAVNTCLNQLQSEKVRPELRWADLSEEQVEMLDSLAATTDDLHPSHHLAARELVEKLLARLDPDDRLVINLLNLEGRSVEEVKRITGWNGPLIKVRAFRARKKLRNHFKQLMKEEKR